MHPVRVTAGVVALLLLGIAAGAQDAPAGNHILSNGNLRRTLLAAPVLGQPYSATEVHGTTRKLADGTTISRKGHHLVARDSEGRVRVETGIARGGNGHPAMFMVFVKDPVANTLTMWVTGGNMKNKVATVVELPAHKDRTTAQRHVPTGNPNRPQPIVTTEDLGPDMFQGIPVTVVRKTIVVPAGRSGNDAPITKTYETWTSPDLQLIVKEQLDDPRIGETIQELDNLSRSEPDPALFRPPAGYAVKNALQTLQDLEQKLKAAQGN